MDLCHYVVMHRVTREILIKYLMLYDEAIEFAGPLNAIVTSRSWYLDNVSQAAQNLEPLPRE